MCHIILNYKEKARAGISILLPLLSQYILNRNDKSEHIPYLENVVRIITTWSEWRESNPRPHGPERSGMKKAEYLEFLETVRLRNTHSLTKCENFLNMLKRTPTACSRK